MNLRFFFYKFHPCIRKLSCDFVSKMLCQKFFSQNKLLPSLCQSATFHDISQRFMHKRTSVVITEIKTYLQLPHAAPGEHPLSTNDGTLSRAIMGYSKKSLGFFYQYFAGGNGSSNVLRELLGKAKTKRRLIHELIDAFTTFLLLVPVCPALLSHPFHPKQIDRQKMPPKRAKKSARPANTKKKQTPLKPAAKKEKAHSALPNNQKPKTATKKVTLQLNKLLRDHKASAQSIVDFVVNSTCGLESAHDWIYCKNNATPFLLAVFANRLDVVQLLMAEHIVNTKAVTDGNYTALHLASENGHLEMVRYLVEQCGLDVQTVADNGKSPLHLAISHMHSDVALLLLELGADPNHSDNKKSTPLLYACMFGLVDAARGLIANGANMEAVCNVGRTSLHWAINYMHSDVALLLLELGADPNHSESGQLTPLHVACCCGQVDVARKLIAKGANIDAVGSCGRSPLQWAIMSKQSDPALLLLELGADPNHTDNFQWTPLHFACGYGLVDVAQVLIVKDVSSNVVNDDGKTPLELADMQNHPEVVALLAARQ